MKIKYGYGYGKNWRKNYGTEYGTVYGSFLKSKVRVRNNHGTYTGSRSIYYKYTIELEPSSKSETAPSKFFFELDIWNYAKSKLAID